MSDPKLICPSHSVAEEALTIMRHHLTPPDEFARQLHRLSLIIATKATTKLELRTVNIQTPLARCVGGILKVHHALVPVMRAGAGMLSAFQTFLPDSVVWHVSVARDEHTFEPLFKDSKVPERINGIETCFVLDPMLATGGTASFTIQHLVERGAQEIVYVGVIGCPQGVKRLQTEFPDVQIFLGDIDPELNEHAYIVPGLGDAGDRFRPTVPWTEGTLAKRLGIIV